MLRVHLVVPANEDGIDNKEHTFCSKSSPCDPQERTNGKNEEES